MTAPSSPSRRRDLADVEIHRMMQHVEVLVARLLRVPFLLELAQLLDQPIADSIALEPASAL